MKRTIVVIIGSSKVFILSVGFAGAISPSISKFLSFSETKNGFGSAWCGDAMMTESIKNKMADVLTFLFLTSWVKLG